MGGIETTVREDNLGLLDLIAMALDDADETADAVALFKAIVTSKNEPLRALRAVHAARRACDWEFAAHLEAQACGVGEVERTVEESVPWRLLSLAGASAAAARGSATERTADRAHASAPGEHHCARRHA